MKGNRLIGPLIHHVAKRISDRVVLRPLTMLAAMTEGPPMADPQPRTTMHRPTGAVI